MSRGRSFSRLNLGAFASLRQRVLSETSVGRREFLIGAAASIGAIVPLTKAAASAANFGGYSLKTRKGRGKSLDRVTLSIYSGCEWTLDRTLYEGNPKLETLKTDKGLTIRLTGARYPGTRFAINLEANVRQNLAGNTIEFKFRGAGAGGSEFHMRAPLADWLQGKKEARARLTADQAAGLFSNKEFFEHASLAAMTSGVIRYEPNGNLVFKGSASLLAEGHEYPLSELALSVQPRTETTFVGGRNRSATLLTAAPADGWQHGITLDSVDGWSVVGDLSGTRNLAYEAHEHGQAAFVLLGGGPLKACLPGHAEFDLQNAQLARLFGVQEDVLFAADMSGDGVWVHDQGLSVEVAPQECRPLVMRLDRKGNLIGSPALEARRVAPVIEGAIVETPKFEPQPVALVVQGTTKVLNPTTTQIKAPVTIQKAPTTVLQKATTLQGGARRNIGIFMKPFVLQVTRPEDMLTLGFEVVNLRISGGTLVREDANKPAYVVITFPSQAIVEGDIPDDPTHPTILPESFTAPLVSYLSQKTKLVFFIPAEQTSIKLSLSADEGLLDWSKWTQAVAPTAISSFGPNIRIDSTWEHPIKSAIENLKLEAPSGDTVAKTGETETLMLYREQVQKSPATFQSSAEKVRLIPKSVNPVLTVPYIPTGPMLLNYYDTAIVMPHGLTISPDERAKWFHQKGGDITTEGNVTRAGLWHTHLGSYLGSDVVDASDDGKWYYTSDPTTGRSGPFPSKTPVHSSIRVIGLPDNGSAYDLHARIMDRVTRAGLNVANPPWLVRPRDSSGVQKLGFIDVMTSRTASSATDSTPFIVDRLMLTALGGYLKGEWTYQDHHQPLGQGGGPEISGWKHISTLGRDHFIKVTRRGFIYPTMHYAVLVSIAERKFRHKQSNKNVYAVMSTRDFIIVKQPTVVYSDAEARALGFKSITMVTKQTPMLDQRLPGLNPAVMQFWCYEQPPTGSSAHIPVKMAVSGVDVDGNVVSWLQHVGFVGFDAATQSPPLQISCVAAGKNPDINSWQGPLPSNLNGQNIAWATPAPRDPTGKKRNGGTDYPCETLWLTANNSAAFNPAQNQPKFRPRMGQAKIRVPQLEHFQPGAGGGPGSTLMLASVNPSTFDSVDAWADAAADWASTEDANDTLGPVVVQFADSFLNSSSQDGFGSDNPSQVLFKLVDQAKALFNDTSKSGGVVSPNMNINALSRLLGPIADDVGSSSNISTSKYDASGGDLSNLGSAAKLLGVVNIWKLLPDQINLVGDGEKVPQVFLKKVFEDDKSDDSGGGSNGPFVEPTALVLDDKDKKVIGIAAGIQWTPKLGNWGFDSSKPIFIGKIGDSTFWRVDATDASSASIKPFKDSEKHSSDFDHDSTLHLEASVTYLFDPSTDEADDKNKKGGGGSGDKGGSSGDKKDPSFGDHFKFELLGELKFFRVNAIAGAASVVLVDVELIQFKLESGSNLKLKVDIPNITFVGPLSFVQKLEDFLGGGSNAVHFPGKNSDSGGEGGGGGGSTELASSSESGYLPVEGGFELKPFFNVDMSGLSLGFTLGIPDISIGVFAMRNISFTAKVTLPWIGDSFTIEFDFCSRDNPFALSVYFITGGGFFGIQLSANGLKMIEAALEFGASISLNIGVASGSVSLMAGIYYKLDNSGGHSVTTLTGYVRLHGELDILGGLISMSLEFYLSLTYTTDGTNSKVEGDASLTVSISILFFSVSVTMSVHKEFAGSSSGGSLLADTVAGALPEPATSAVLFTSAVTSDNWNAYCQAFGGNA